MKKPRIRIGISYKVIERSMAHLHHIVCLVGVKNESLQADLF